MIIVGLGNPGEKYEKSRHNVGFQALESLRLSLGQEAFSLKSKLQAEISKKGDDILVKPQAFMNNSGQVVRAVLSYFTDWKPKAALDFLYVVHDDLDLAVGSFKIQFATGPKQHNGLLSLYEHLGTSQFWHVRVGVDGRAGDRSIPSDQYVLQPPPQAEAALISDVLTQVVLEMKHKVV